MLRSLLLLPLLSISSPAGFARPAVDVAGAIERLANPMAVERLAAQRWLSVNLRRGDFPLVAEAARGGEPEVSRRLSQALAADGRHLPLAMLLLTDLEPQVSDLGERAVAGMIDAWSASARDQVLRRFELPDVWSERWPRVLALDPEAGGLAQVVDRLDRLGAGPAPLVLDPSLDPDVRRNVPDRELVRRDLEGPWASLLQQLTATHRVSFEVFGFRGSGEAEFERSRAFVRIAKRGDEGDADSVRHLMDWCRGVVREQDRRWNTACARALASTGWPAALAWLEERWVLLGDPAALEGLLMAAGRGRVAPVLARPARMRALLAEADGRLAAQTFGARIFAERVARALAASGPSGPSGEPLAEVLLEGWKSLGVLSRWMRLVALEGQARVDSEAEQRCRALLASDSPAGLRLQALRTLVHVRDPAAPGLVVRSPVALFTRARAEGRLEELARNLIAVGARPPEGSRRGRGKSRSERLAWLLWDLGSGDLDRALDDFTVLLDTRDAREIARRLSRWAGLGGDAALRDLVARARPHVADHPERARTLRRVALLAGLLSSKDQAVTLERLLAAPRGGRSLLDLAALAGAEDPVGERARESLLVGLNVGAPLEELQPAVELAVDVLRRARLDEIDEVFQAALRSAAARKGHPLAEVMYGRGWPPVVPIPPRALEAGERRPLGL